MCFAQCVATHLLGRQGVLGREIVLGTSFILYILNTNCREDIASKARQNWCQFQFRNLTWFLAKLTTVGEMVEFWRGILARRGNFGEELLETEN